MGPTNLSPKHSGAITLLSTGLVSECPPVTPSLRPRWQMCRELLLSDPVVTLNSTAVPSWVRETTGPCALHRQASQARSLWEHWQAGSESQTSLCVSYTSQNQTVTFWRPEGSHDLMCALLRLCGAGLSSDTGDPMHQGLQYPIWGMPDTNYPNLREPSASSLPAPCTYTVSAFSNKSDG